MKPGPIVGVLLVLAGAFVLYRSPSITTRRDVLRVGDMKVSADEQRTLPPWSGGALVVTGVVILALGLRGRKLT